MSDFKNITIDTIQADLITFADVIIEYKINPAVLAEDADISYFSVTDYQNGVRRKSIHKITARVLAEELTKITGATYTPAMVTALIMNGQKVSDGE